MSDQKDPRQIYHVLKLGDAGNFEKTSVYADRMNVTERGDLVFTSHIAQGMRKNPSTDMLERMYSPEVVLMVAAGDWKDAALVNPKANTYEFELTDQESETGNKIAPAIVQP